MSEAVTAIPRQDSAERRRATYQDVLDAPRNRVAEVVDGVLHTNPRPALRHAHASSSLGTKIGGPFHHDAGGPSLTKGATPVLSPAETWALRDEIDTGTAVALRGPVAAERRAGSAAVGMCRQGYLWQGTRGWLRVQGERCGIDPGFPQGTDVQLHLSGEAPKDGASAGVTMAAALVSACAGRPPPRRPRHDGRDHPLRPRAAGRGIRDRVLAAHRCGLTRVLLPEQNRQDVDEKLGADLPRAHHVHYVTTMDGLLDLALPAATCRARRPRRGGSRTPRR